MKEQYAKFEEIEKVKKIFEVIIKSDGWCTSNLTTRKDLWKKAVKVILNSFSEEEVEAIFHELSTKLEWVNISATLYKLERALNISHTFGQDDKKIGVLKKRTDGILKEIKELAAIKKQQLNKNRISDDLDRFAETFEKIDDLYDEIRDIRTPKDLALKIYDYLGEEPDNDMDGVEGITKLISKYTRKVANFQVVKAAQNIKDEINRCLIYVDNDSFHAHKRCLRICEDVISSNVEPEILSPCIIGEYCEFHQCVHGEEAEQLRKALEKMINDYEERGDDSTPNEDIDTLLDDIDTLLDDIDASDSRAFLESKLYEK